MAVAINQTQQRQENKESDLDKLAKLVGIGTNVLQGVDAYKSIPGREAQAQAAKLELENKSNQAAMQRRWESGKVTDADVLAQNKDYMFTDDPNKFEGARKFEVERAPGSFNPNEPYQPQYKYAISRADHDSKLNEMVKKAQIAKDYADASRLKSEANKKSLGRDLPAGDAVLIGGADSAFKALDDMSSVFSANPDITGPGVGQISKIKGWLEMGEGGTRAKTFDAQAQANAQIIGKFLEGGKLAEGDIKRYRSMLPGLGDSPEAAQGKIQILQNLIAQKQQAELSALKNAGFNTGGLTVNPMRQNPNMQGLTADGKQALPSIPVPRELQGLTPQQQLDIVTRKLIEKNGITSTLPKRKPGT